MEEDFRYVGCQKKREYDREGNNRPLKASLGPRDPGMDPERSVSGCTGLADFCRRFDFGKAGAALSWLGLELTALLASHFSDTAIISYT